MSLSQNDDGQCLAVVLGGYVNGYSIIRELHEQGVPHIWLIDSHRSLASFSNKIKGFSKLDDDLSSLATTLLQLSTHYGKLVVFPSSDLHLENLYAIYDQIYHFCFLPFNQENLLASLNKRIQYAHCERLGVPYPRSVELADQKGFEALRSLQYPLLLKPSKRDDLSTDVFRNLLLETSADLNKHEEKLRRFVGRGISLLASELVPGDDTEIYAYTAYRSREGKILNEWIGKKLTQYPDRFGVFSSASNDAPEQVRRLGRLLVEGMDLHGIVEPEFKYDARDGQFKLMEVNLRSMMWHRLGNRSGIKLQYTQWQDARGLPVEAQEQQRNRRIHFVYMKHEVANLLTRRGYCRHFLHNVFGCDERHFAVFELSDVKPAIWDLFSYPRVITAIWLKRLGLR